MRKLLCMTLGLLLFCAQVIAQNRTVTGTVTDESGNPLPNVTVQVKGSNQGTTTDATGNYSIVVPATARALVFSSVNTASQEVTIGANAQINAILVATDRNMQEVVVTGYTTRKRSQFTGASSKIDDKNIQQVPIASFDQILQGRAPGLFVGSGSGQPGSAAQVIIRGAGSFNGTTPLYVVDGVPIEAAVFRTLNPNDFESVDVLKDASGASLYGSRGANGVIVITTKRGRAGKTRVQYRAQAGITGAPKNNIKMMNTEERLRFEEEILGPSGILSANAAGLTGYPGWDYSKANPRYATLNAEQQARADQLLDSVGQINTDWQDIFFRNGKFTSHEVNASGGNGPTSFYTSLSYYHQDGAVMRSELDRYTFRANVDFKTDRLTVQVRSGAGWSSQSGIESEAGVALANPIAAAFLTLPYERLYRPNGTVNTGAGRIGPNAFDRLNTTTSVSNQFKGTLGITAQFNIWNGISLRSTNGVDYRNTNNSRFIDPNSFAGISLTGNGGQGSYGETNSENLQLISTSGLVYTKNINNRHAINAQALLEVIRNKNRGNGFTGFGINPKLPNTPAAITAGSATNGFIPSLSNLFKTQNGIYSLIGVADYTLDDKYSFSASIRRDAPSQVPKKNRNNIFWSAGASWNLGQEEFMQNQNVVQNLRLRASYGTAANAAGFTSDFGYIPSYGSGSYAGTPAIVPASPGNLDYKLESQEIANIGVEASFWDSRIQATVELYNKQSKNLFVNQNLSRTTGFNSLQTNAGVMRNRGIELGLNADLLRKQDLTVTFGVNAAYNDNEVTSLGGLTEIPFGTGLLRVGKPFGSHFQVGWVGVDPQTGNPIYTDIDGNPTATYSASNNRADFGTYLPKWTGGTSLDARYKGFDVSILFSFVQDVQRFNNERFFYEGGNNGFQYNQRADMLYQAWRKPGDETNFQRIGAGSTRQFTSKDINDAAFVRFRNLQIGYTYQFKSARPINGFRVYVQGQNLYTWTKWQGFDPEESNNIATYEFPNPRTFTAGIDINF